MAMKRLQYELKKFAQEPQDAIRAGPIDQDNMFRWWATIEGPGSSPFAGGVFRILIEYSTEYPFKPPKVRFLTKIFHPNISDRGEISVDILQNGWSPALKTSTVLMSIRSLLHSPVDDPIQMEIGSMFLNNRNEYERMARAWTKMYATSGARASVSTAAAHRRSAVVHRFAEIFCHLSAICEDLVRRDENNSFSPHSLQEIAPMISYKSVYMNSAGVPDVQCPVTYALQSNGSYA